MGNVFCLEDAHHSDAWFDSPLGRTAFGLQKHVIQKVWADPSPQRVLQVGCGGGRFLEWLAGQGHTVAGLDPSAAALKLARARLPRRVQLERGHAERLPYDDNEFDTVALITSLEFANNPAEALREACRVASKHLLIGALNKYSIAHVQHFFERLWTGGQSGHARFFSVFELRDMVSSVLSGPVPHVWKTCFSLPLPALRYFYFLERLSLLHLHPFGHFIAMRFDMRIILRTAQTPVFSELPSGLGAQAPVQSSRVPSPSARAALGWRNPARSS